MKHEEIIALVALVGVAAFVIGARWQQQRAQQKAQAAIADPMDWMLNSTWNGS